MKPVTCASPLNMFEEWESLLLHNPLPLTALDCRVLTEREQPQDDDPTPYRNDRRIDFAYLGSKRTAGHQAIVSCESDDERYRLFFSIEEISATAAPNKVVYRQELQRFGPQVLRLNSNDLQGGVRPVVPNVPIRIVIGVSKPA